MATSSGDEHEHGQHHQDGDGDGDDCSELIVVLLQVEEDPARQGNTKLNPGPRKNEPMITSTAQNIMKMVKIEMANLRSSGL